VDAVLPVVPLRQYVLAMPPDLHHRLARNAPLESQVLAIFVEELTGHLRATSDPTGELGFVTVFRSSGRPRIFTNHGPSCSHGDHGHGCVRSLGTTVKAANRVASPPRPLRSFTAV
jgi:hypothetical protein